MTRLAMAGRYDTPEPQQPLSSAKPRAKILVVDDDANNVRVLQGYLTLDGYDVWTAFSGAEALATLEQRPVDLVVLDVRMPDLDGLEVCRRIRNEPRFARLPVIFLTADQADETRELAGLDVGGDEFLHKPLSRKVLAARVRNLLRLVDAERERKLVEQVSQSEKLAAIGQVAAGVAHEINNPLSFILSNLESLKGYFDDMRAVLAAYRADPAQGRALDEKLVLDSVLDDVRPLLEETVAGGKRVRSIVHELKTFARGDEGDLLEEVDLADVARSTLLLTEREICGKALLVRDLQPAVVRQAPRQKLHQVVLNLVVNALQALDTKKVDSPRRHTMRVTTRVEGAEAVLEISDSGCGIPEQHLRRIFEPFFTTKPVGVGTGLGLSVCAMVVQTLGGRIEVHSRVGEGTTFFVYVPREAPQNP